MTVLWQWAKLSAALSARSQAGPDVMRVAFDSRKTQPGDLFLALPGDPGPKFNPSQRSKVDGHAFLADAKSKGAVGAVVQSLQQHVDLPKSLSTTPTMRFGDWANCSPTSRTTGFGSDRQQW